MNKILNLTTLTTLIVTSFNLGIGVAQTNNNSSLFVAYPPNNHQTSATQIFFIGTASPEGEVLVNNQPISRSKQGHFAPSFPLKIGENEFILRYQDE
jgi:N-acetylmuramoyl-L-alanine amidase